MYLLQSIWNHDELEGGCLDESVIMAIAVVAVAIAKGAVMNLNVPLHLYRIYIQQ